MHNYYLLELLKDGMDISLISSQIEQNKAYYSFKHIPFNGISADLPLVSWRLAKNKFLRNGLRSLQDWRISLAIAKSIKSQPVDVIEFMDIHSEGYAYLRENPRKNRKTKVIIRSHTPWGLLRSYYSNKERQGVDGWWSVNRENYCFKACEAVTTPSQDLKNKLIKIYNLPDEKITVIPNIIDTNHFKPYKDEIKNKIGFKILHVGRFERSKGVETLIKAFIKIAKKYHDVSLINVGKLRGSSAATCESWLEKENLLDRVSFMDFIDYEQLPQYYHESDLVIVPSEIYESFSYTVAQALSCGKIVIASKIGGIPETVDFGKAGILFTPGHVEELEKKIESIYLKKVNVPEIEVHARNHVMEKFSIQALKGEYIQFYQSLLI